MGKIRKTFKTGFLAIMITLASVSTLGLCLVANTDLSTMQIQTGDVEKQEALPIESTKTVQGKPTGITQSGSTITCESLVQGIRDCNLANGTYTFKVVRKSWFIARNKKLCSRTYKLL